MITNIKAYKSTTLGVALIVLATFIIIKGLSVNEYITGGLILSGIILILSPDKYINILEKIIGIKSKE